MFFRCLILALIPSLTYGSQSMNCEGVDKLSCRKKIVEVLEVKKKIDSDIISFFETTCTKNAEPVACVALGVVDKEQAFPVKKETLKVLESECMKKDPVACWAAAQIHAQGLHTVVSVKKAKELYEKACGENLSISCTAQGALLEQDEKPDHAGALSLYDKGCELKDSEGCVRSGAIHLSEPKKDTAKATESFRKSCDLNHLTGCRILGALLIQKKESEEEALRFLIKSCALGEPLGCRVSGLFYLEDRPEKSLDKAILYLEKGCKYKDADACFEAGSLYSEGLAFNSEKIEIDKARSYEFLTAACELDHGKACSMAIRRVPAGDKVSMEAIGKACLAGDSVACRNGGDSYKEEKLIEQASTSCDEKDTESCLALVKYYDQQGLARRVNEYQIKACDAGHVETCFSLGEEFVNAGLMGNKKRRSEMFSTAREYFKISCQLKHGPSCERLKQIK